MYVWIKLVEVVFIEVFSNLHLGRCYFFSLKKEGVVLRIFLLSFVLFGTTVYVQPVWAWGRTGHRIVGEIAQEHLTSGTLKRLSPAVRKCSL